MAALNQERLTLATNDTIEELRNGAKNINTSKSTSFWLSVWKTWCKGMNIALDIEEHKPAELNRLLEKFYAEVKNKHGQDYEPDSLRVIVKVTGHKNIQSLEDYDEAKEDEQRQLSYAIAGRNNFNPQPTISRDLTFPGCQQEPLASSAQFLQPSRARMPLQPILMPNSSEFGLNQSSTSLNPTMMKAQLLPRFIQLQELQVFKSSHSKCEAH